MGTHTAEDGVIAMTGERLPFAGVGDHIRRETQLNIKADIRTGSNVHEHLAPTRPYKVLEFKSLDERERRT